MKGLEPRLFNFGQNCTNCAHKSFYPLLSNDQKLEGLNGDASFSQPYWAIPRDEIFKAKLSENRISQLTLKS